VVEPELITILEGPTPNFQVTPFLWAQSIQEGPNASAVALCELRTNTGHDIMQRCRDAWHEGRSVRLDFPDELRMRQQIEVVAMRLHDIEEGKVLMLWVREPFDPDDFEDIEEEEGFDDDDGFSY